MRDIRVSTAQTPLDSAALGSRPEPERGSLVTGTGGHRGHWDWWSQGSVVTGTGGHGGQWSGRLVSQRLLATGINGQKGWGLQGSMVTGISGHRVAGHWDW